MIDPPQTHYAKTADGVHIAYQVSGDAPLDLLLMTAVTSHIELAWEMPTFARVFRRLASFSRLIRFDTRGSGLSDPLSLSEPPTLEERGLVMERHIESRTAESGDGCRDICHLEDWLETGDEPGVRDELRLAVALNI